MNVCPSRGGAYGGAELQADFTAEEFREILDEAEFGTRDGRHHQGHRR